MLTLTGYEPPGFANNSKKKISIDAILSKTQEKNI